MNDMYGNQAQLAGAVYGAPLGLQQSTFLDKLNHKKVYLEAELEKVNGAITALESNPEINKVVSAIMQANLVY